MHRNYMTVQNAFFKYVVLESVEWSRHRSRELYLFHYKCTSSETNN